MISLAPGTRLGPYEITAPLGAGGMGEVWRANDTRLGREAALKLLPEELAADPERRSRLEREARTLAALDHPGIATLYGLEELDGQHVLVMELVEGEGLDELVARGPMAADDAIDIALQIATALEAAHETGIVHRDLKPANVRVRPDGTVKVLDFGLAKAWAEEGDTDLALSPTLTRHHTAAGILLGTAAYMAPEQARGRPVDRRADIWAFGVVLWEMLTGRQLFTGETVSDVLAAVLREIPPVDALPDDIPPAVRRLLERCLERDPRHRLQWIGDARVDLERIEEEPPGAEAAPRRSRQRRLPWLVASAAAVAALALAGVLLLRRPPPPQITRFNVEPPPGGSFALEPDNPGPAAVSPDGRMIVFSGAAEDGIDRLWLRTMDAVELRALPGTENAAYPFWSPDSRQIAFFAGGKLQTVEAAGGAPLALCSAKEGKGGAWSERGVIVFAPSYNTPLFRVPATGGVPTPVTELDAARHDNSHRHPRFLPDERHFLYMVRAPSHDQEGQVVAVGSLDGASQELPLRSPADVEYASGHLLYPRDGTLMAQPFDAGRLRFTGPAFPVASDITLLPSGTVAGVYSASQNGVLVFQQGRWFGTRAQLQWRSRDGRALGDVGPPGAIYEVALVPGGDRVLYGLNREANRSQDLWLFDLRRGVASRFTFDDAVEFSATVSPDAKTVYFGTESGGTFTLHRKELGGSGTSQVLLERGSDLFPTGVSPDGRTLVFTQGGVDTGYDVWVMPADGSGEPSPLLRTPFAEQAAAISPDGRWLAYQSDESGQDEVYVTSYPDTIGKWQVSSGGGALPRWGRGGREIVYQAPNGDLMAVSLQERPGGIVAGSPAVLFSTGFTTSRFRLWSISPDDDRVLMAAPIPGQDPTRLTVVTNWLAARGNR